MERVRRDLGYYKPSNQEVGALEAEIRGLREQLRQALDRQDNRLQRIEAELKALGKSANRPQEPSKAATAAGEGTRHPVPPASSAKALGAVSVCSRGCDFQDLQMAVDAAPSGGAVAVAAEVNGGCAVIRKPLHLLGMRTEDGRRPHLAGGVCMGKAPLVTAAANIVIEGFEISGVSVADENGACIRLDPESRDLEIRNLYCHDSQNGLLGHAEGLLLIEDSVFEGNGFANGRSHGLYLMSNGEVLIRRSQILASKNAGHSLKIGAQKLVVEDSVVAALNAHNSRALDAFAGGEVELRRNVIQQGPKSDNSEAIGLALEPSRLFPGGHSFLMEDNWVIYDSPNRGTKVLLRGRKLGPIVVRHNKWVGMTGMGIDGVTDEDNTRYETRDQAGLPPYDGALRSLPAPGKSAATK